MDQRTIKRGISALCQVDPELAAAVEQVGLPEARKRPVGFATFFAIILSQQISTEASRAIMQRVEQLVPELTPAALLATDDEHLRSAGLSYRKIEYAKGVAEAIQSGAFDPEELVAMADGEAISTISGLRGFGRWSAEIYLMFSLGRKDLFPGDDLALRVALGRLKGLQETPTPAQARTLVEHWSPWRSVGSLFLWHYYRGVPT